MSMRRSHHWCRVLQCGFFRIRVLVPTAHPLLIHRGQKVRPQEVDGRGPWVWFYNVLEITFDIYFLIIGTCCVPANTKMVGWIEAGNFLMMHFRRFHSFSSAPKGEGAMRAAALRNLLEKFIFGKSKYCIPIWKEAVRINARNFPELSYDAFPEVLQL